MALTATLGLHCPMYVDDSLCDECYIGWRRGIAWKAVERVCATPENGAEDNYTTEGLRLWRSHLPPSNNYSNSSIECVLQLEGRNSGPDNNLKGVTLQGAHKNNHRNRSLSQMDRTQLQSAALRGIGTV